MMQYRANQNMVKKSLIFKPTGLEELPALVELDRHCLGGMWTLTGYQQEFDHSHSHLFTLMLLGSFSLQQLLAQAIQQKLERATLEVKASNQVAIALYQKYGFKVAGTRKGYYQETGEDALILWKNGLDSDAFQQQLVTHQLSIQAKLEQQGFEFIG
jgi:ribosomal-protein-alanine N-acetyltransferase